MIFLGVIQFLVIGIICIYEFRRKSAAVFLWATLMVMFGVMHLISSFIGDMVYSNETLVQTSVFVILFCLIYISTRYILGINNCKKNIIQWDHVSNVISKEKKAQRNLIILLAINIVVMLFPYINSVGSILNTSWSNGRDYIATLDYANYLQVVRILFYVFAGVTIASWLSKHYVYTIIAIIILAMNVIVSRNRIEVLPILCSVIAIVVIKTKKIRISTIIFGAFAAVAVIYVVYGLRVFRHYGTVEIFIKDFVFSEFIGKINLYLQTDNGELGLRKVFYHFVANDNRFNDFGEFNTYKRMLMVFIPTRFSFGLKPDDFAIAMGSAMGMVEGGSTHPTLFGDCYANGGMFGVFLGVFWAIYASLGDKIILVQKNVIAKSLLYLLFGVTYVIMGRGSVYNAFFYLAYGVVIILICSYIFKKVKLRRKFLGDK